MVQKGKELRNQRQVLFYQPTDYYQFEPPVPQPISEDGESEENVRDTYIKNTEAKDPLQLQKWLSKICNSLEIYGHIQTICPSEFFIAEFWENPVLKKKS